MKLAPIAVDHDKFKRDVSERNFIDDILNSAFEQAVFKQNKLILKALENKGFTFSTLEDQIEFFKTKVTAYQFGNDDLKHIYVGDTAICVVGQPKLSGGESGISPTGEPHFNFEFQFQEAP